MGKSKEKIEIYFETGDSKTFAGAIEWPGWCRSGKDEAAAIQSLLEYAPRYAAVIKGSRLAFPSPKEPGDFKTVERLEGNATTDFGAPDLAPGQDSEALDELELKRLQAILKACWRALDRAAQAAQGKELRKGPRGGGRDLDKMLSHVYEAERSYLRTLGWQFKEDNQADLEAKMGQIRIEIQKGLAASVSGELPATGPRGGKRWTARYFVRRSAWHVLDHAWELEYRILD
jgi:hypothetical protein